MSSEDKDKKQLRINIMLDINNNLNELIELLKFDGTNEIIDVDLFLACKSIRSLILERLSILDK